MSGAFYFTVGNLPPKARSKLDAIYLVALCKHKLLAKYGIDKVLQPLIEDMKKLVRIPILNPEAKNVHMLPCIQQEKGYTFTVHGKKHTVYGTIAAAAADNLGSLLLGGFKESCTAHRMCRHCMATRETAKTMVQW